jgi:hypothetical protein
MLITKLIEKRALAVFSATPFCLRKYFSWKGVHILCGRTPKFILIFRRYQISEIYYGSLAINSLPLLISTPTVTNEDIVCHMVIYISLTINIRESWEGWTYVCICVCKKKSRILDINGKLYYIIYKVLKLECNLNRYKQKT